MQWYIFVIPAFLLSTCNAQRITEIQRDDGSYSIGVNSNSVGGTGDSVAALIGKASGWTEQSGFSGIKNVNVDIPNFLASGVQIVKQVPYVEILKLVESFLKIKGELGGRVWALVYENGHILAALRDTLVSKISTIHGLTLSFVVILRKVLEFASALLGGVSVNAGAGVNFG